MPSPVVVSLPVEDRARAHAFYRLGVGLEAVGPLAGDGLPEPLQFVVNDGLRLMLVPRAGFGWVIGDREVAAGQVECLLSLRELVRLRTALLNGCVFCIDLHWAKARRLGEPEARLAQLAAWRESPALDARERAALALTDAVTQVAESGVPDAVWTRAEQEFAPDELAHLLFAIAAINLLTRIAISTRMAPAVPRARPTGEVA